ncbi:MAG: hypothetical protein GX235_12175 [Clostridiales bacterium]|nr:hypothetical protein [Clostridiales bacterium]
MLFRCKNCGGNTVFSPSVGKMYCPHCDGIDSEEKEDKGTQTECVNCGAPLTIGEYNSTCQCEYCGSYIILNERVDGKYRPDLVLPFKIDKKSVVDMLRAEFKKRIFTPESFLSEATLKDMKGIYVPFWMYDYAARYEYEGKGTKVRVWTTGDTEYTETSYYRIERDMNVDFDKIPVDASIAMQNDVMDLMEPYDYQQLEGFAEKYMSGFFGEIYNEDSDTLEDRARTKANKDMEDLLQGTISGYTTVVPENKNVTMNKKGVHYTLLPVWHYLYKYKDKDYDFYVNGQTGKIIGSTPVSKAKVLSYGATVFVFAWMALSFIIGILEVI